MCLCAIIQDEYLRLDSAFETSFQNGIHFVTFCMLSIFSCKYRPTVSPLRFTHNDYRLPNPDPGLETSRIFLTISSNLQQIHNAGSNRAWQGTLHCPCNCKGECWSLQHQLSNSQGNLAFTLQHQLGACLFGPTSPLYLQAGSNIMLICIPQVYSLYHRNQHLGLQTPTFPSLHRIVL